MFSTVDSRDNFCKAPTAINNKIKENLKKINTT